MKRDRKSDVLSVIAIGVAALILLAGYFVGYFGLSNTRFTLQNGNTIFHHRSNRKRPASLTPIGEKDPRMLVDQAKMTFAKSLGVKKRLLTHLLTSPFAHPGS